MVALNDLPADILYQIAELCSKADLLSLRLMSHNLSDFLVLYVDKYLASEVCCERHTHLHRAVATQDDYGRIMVARLLKASAPVDQRDKNAETALHVACGVGNIDGARSLLNAGSDVDALSSQEWTPLRLTCRYRHADITRLLLDFGADPNESGHFGGTAWEYAFRNGHKDCLRVLVQYGATESMSRQGSRNTAVREVKQEWGIYTSATCN